MSVEKLRLIFKQMFDLHLPAILCKLHSSTNTSWVTPLTKHVNHFLDSHQCFQVPILCSDGKQ